MQIAGALAAILLIAGFTEAQEGDLPPMKRRQQGILTGMPFMANLAPRTFVDDLGRKIYLAKAPNRIVSLAPSVTEILFAIGVSERIIGVTQFCDYPPEAKAKPKVGASQPNIESLLALNPDLVIAPRAFIRPDVLDKLDQLKITVYILDAKTIEDILSHIQTLGRMLDRSAAADELATSMRRRITDVKTRTQALTHRRLLYVLNSDPLVTVGPGSFIHQLIEMAGGTNVGAAMQTPYPRLSLEEALRQDPEIIVFPVGTTEGIPETEQQRWQRWPTMSAVKQGRFYRISSVLLDRPGPRIVEGLEALARSIHPEAFESRRSQ
jgi:iron complex transport system substrate-binding protein